MPRRLAPLLLVLAAFPSQAQTWEIFDPVTAGLPTVSITDIAEDDQGNIWVGTEQGLCKYDGTVWTVLQTDNSGLPDNQITAVAVDSADNVWIGTVLGGLAVYDGAANWTYYTLANSPLPDDQITALTIDHRNWVWIGTFLGLMCYTGSEWRFYNDQPTSYNGLVLNGTVIRDVAIRESDGLVMIGTLNGGFHFMSETMVDVHATYIDEFFDNTQNGVAFDTLSDERWLATPSQGLIRSFGDWLGGFFFQYSVDNSLIPSNSLLCLAMDAVGRPWMGSVEMGVIARNTDDTFINYHPGNSPMPDEGVTCLLWASDGSLWMGTYGGGAVRMTPTTNVPETVMRASVFPNPVSEWCSISASGMTGTFAWELRSANGARVQTGTSQGGPLMLDISAMGPGVYIIALSGSQGSAVARLVK